RLTALDKYGAAMVLQDADGVDVASQRVVQVAHVGGPIPVASGGSERHLLLLLASSGLRLLQAVEPAVERQDPPAGAGAQGYAQLPEGGVDTEFTEFRVLLQSSDGVHGSQAHFANALRSP